MTWRDARVWMRERNHERQWSLSDAYIGLVAVAMVCALGVPLLRQIAVSQVLVLTPMSFLGLVVAQVALSAVGAWLFGPLGISAATAFWLASTPMDRGGLTGPLLLRALLVALLLGAAMAVGLWLLAGISAWCVLAVVIPVGMTAAMVLFQVGWWWSPWAAGAALVAAGGAGGAWMPLLGAVMAALVTVVLVVLAWRARRRFDRFALSAQGRRNAALSGATFGADTGLAIDLLQGRTHHALPGRLHGWGTGAMAVAGIDVQRVLRRGVIPLAALLVADVAVTLMSAGPVVLAAVLMVPMAVLMTSLRRLQLSLGLRRAFPSSRAQMAGFLAGAAVVTAANVLVSALIGVPFWGSVAANLVALAGAIRMVTARPPDFSRGLLVTDAGAIPVGAVLSAIRGFDLLLLFALVAALGVAGPALAFSALTLAALPVVHATAPTRP